MKICQTTLLLLIFCIIGTNCNNEEIIIQQSNNAGNFIVDYSPSWSPNGNVIVFIHADSEVSKEGIYIIDTNGTNKRMLFACTATSVQISPNGDWIVFDNKGQIFKMNVNGDSLTQLTYVGLNFYPTFRPDGQMIAFDSDLESNGMRGIWKMNIDGTNKTRIIYEPDIGEVRMPNWTKNQNILVVTRYIKDTGYDPEIALIDTNGFTLSVLTNDNNFDIIPVMAPDQKYVVFTSQHFNNIIYKLYSVDINGQSLQKLTSHGYSADFSPDGENVVFCNCSPSNGKLWILRMSNKSKKQLTF